jgi:hypothetical protein
VACRGSGIGRREEGSGDCEGSSDGESSVSIGAFIGVMKLCRVVH